MVHKITFKIDNQTPYSLKPNGQYAYWGETVSGPDTFWHVRSSPAALVQAVGYTIANPGVWFGMLGSDPDLSTEDNKACVAMSTT
ncbi:hypothetical protein FPHYL_7220 [Fusarium phyllophilum]|uniref:Uncharacterized protein n=1 Tax=Fusarium phyllophilum TaxID=47803 RepID=A0A8H5NBF3_9HYPO|nr:hypothetical protein FPHYL_7220 [Fusarium phyllophilum]